MTPQKKIRKLIDACKKAEKHITEESRLAGRIQGLMDAIELLGAEPQPDPEPVPGRWYWVKRFEGKGRPIKYHVHGFFYGIEDGFISHKDVFDWNPYPININE